MPHSSLDRLASDTTGINKFCSHRQSLDNAGGICGIMCNVGDFRPMVWESLFLCSSDVGPLRVVWVTPLEIGGVSWTGIVSAEFWAKTLGTFMRGTRGLIAKTGYTTPSLSVSMMANLSLQSVSHDAPYKFHVIARDQQSLAGIFTASVQICISSRSGVLPGKLWRTRLHRSAH